MLAMPINEFVNRDSAVDIYWNGTAAPFTFDDGFKIEEIVHRAVVLVDIQEGEPEEFIDAVSSRNAEYEKPAVACLNSLFLRHN